MDPQQRVRVLIIDDDPLVSTALRRLLRGCDVTVVNSGREGLELLRTDTSFEVVLCDLMMPDISGIDVFESLEKQQSELLSRFVFMTGGVFTDRASDFLDRIPNERLQKPFDANTLRSAVEGVAKR